MRILVVSPVIPFPPVSGFAIRVYQVLRLLAQHHAVTLLAYARREDSAHIPSVEALGVTVHTVPADEGARTKRWSQLSSMLSPRSFQRRASYSAEMQRTLGDLSSTGRYDVIQIESSQLDCFRVDPRAARVVVEHDIVFELLARIAQTERSIARRAYNSIESRRFRRDEIESWRRADGVIAMSNRDARTIERLAPSTPTLVAPNGVDPEYFQPTGRAASGDVLVMTGFMKTRPNIDAAVFFVKDVLPRILAKRPAAVVYLVGGGAPPEVERLAGHNVVVTGGVSDVRPYLEKASVCVVPIRMGGGTRLKVLEGLSMRMGMVSTSVGCEGLDVTHGTHLLIADDAPAFADAVLELLGAPELRSRLGRDGRALVEQKYRWPAIVHDIEVFYQALCHSARRPVPVPLK